MDLGVADLLPMRPGPKGASDMFSRVSRLEEMTRLGRVCSVGVDLRELVSALRSAAREDVAVPSSGNGAA